NVHVVVFDALVRRIDVVTETGTNAAMFIGGHRGTDPAATDDHSSLARAAGHHDGNGARKVRIVDRFVAVRAKVLDPVAERVQVLADHEFQPDSGVVGPECYAHADTRSVAARFAQETCSRASLTT